MHRISVVTTEVEIVDCVRVMRAAFGTVAREFGLTEANAPTNPAFVTVEKLRDYLRKPLRFYCLSVEGEVAGCIAVEKSAKEEGTYYIERLAVAPEHRHHGYGAELLSYAIDRIKESGGSVASLGMMNDNALLKDWYVRHGFVETSRKRFPHLPFEVCFMSRPLP